MFLVEAPAVTPTGGLNTGLEVLPHAECIRLLACEDFGRLGVVIAGKPEIFPLNYVLDHDDAVVFRTGPGTKLTGPVVFEVDRLDRDAGSGWSVVVHGSTRRVPRPNRPSCGAGWRHLPCILAVPTSPICSEWFRPR